MILLPDVLEISSSQDLGTYHTIKIGRAEKQKLFKISGDKKGASWEMNKWRIAWKRLETGTVLCRIARDCFEDVISSFIGY